MTFDRTIPAAALLVLASACGGSGRMSPSSPQAAAIGRARSEMSAAWAAGDVDAFLRHVAPGARLRIGRDTMDLRGAVLLMQPRRVEGSTLWFAPRGLRTCDRSLYETGGQLGLRTPERPLYRYAATWAVDSSGVARVTEAALVAGESGGSPPGVEGCRPTVKERFDPRRIQVAILPGSGLATLGPSGDIESAMRSRTFDVRSVEPSRFKPVWHVPTLGMVRYQLTHAVGIGVMGTLGTATARTSGADTTNALVIGARVDQKWIAPMLEARFRDLRIGVGPAIVREAWEISTDELDTAATTPVIIGHVATAANKQSRVGFLGQVSLTAPVTTRIFLDARAWYLSAGTSTSPTAFGFAPVQAKTGGAGIGVAFGVAF